MDDSWTQYPPSIHSYSYHTCGLAGNGVDGDLEFVTVGGYDSKNVEIFNFATSRWRYVKSIFSKSYGLP